MSASTHRFVMSVIPNDDYTKSPEGGSIRDSDASVRSDQVAIDLDETQPSGESHLPVVGVPGFSALVFGPSASVRVQARRSLDHGWGHIVIPHPILNNFMLGS
jgi:hypothetical protein